MSTKKTIQINPELFRYPGVNKTKRNKEKRQLNFTPVVSPNNLKNTLLKRIKEHKTKELQQTKNTLPTNDNKDNNYTDEFYGAINYLSDLSKKQKQQTALNNKTVKNYSSTLPTSQSIHNPQISLDLPPELYSSFKPNIQTTDVFNVNYKVDESVPYGCLKNGKKKILIQNLSL